MELENRLLSLIPKTGDYISGFADLEGLLHPNFKDYSSAFVIGKKLDAKIIDRLAINGPTPEYYDLCKKTNKALDSLITSVSLLLNENKIKNIPMVATGNKDSSYYLQDYPTTLRMAFSHKMAATRAGLGWIGKTDLFISKQFGPRVRLASVLTNYKFNYPCAPVTESFCGDCGVCVAACPAKAATGKLWDIKTDRNEFFDAFKCGAKAQELALRNINVNERVCGICVSVCPEGKK